MAETEGYKIFITNRQNYEAYENKGDNIFFVREDSPESPHALSLYVGEAKQCDLLEIPELPGDNNEPVDIGDPINGYNIPPEFRIKDKLLFYNQQLVVDAVRDEEDPTTVNDITENFIHLFMYNDSLGRFLECGIHSNVLVVSGDDLPSEGIENYVYIQPSKKAIYAFVGNEYHSLIDLSGYVTEEESSNYATIEMLNSYALASDIPSADGTTIINNNKVFSADIAYADGTTITDTRVNNKRTFSSDIAYADGTTISDTRVNGKRTFSSGINLSTSYLATSDGNVFADTHVPLKTLRENLNVSTANVTITTLPRNGYETIISSSTAIEQITISDISLMKTGSGTSVARTDDYLGVIILKRHTDLTDVNSILTNFTSAQQHIYLLNPELDISAASIIHLLVYYDGFNVCAIAACYTELPSE